MATILAGSSAKAQSPDTDSQSAERLLEEAFGEHWSWVCQTLHYLVGDWDEAEDLALQVFMRLHQKPPDDVGTGSWLHRVAMNTGYNALRSRQRRQRYEQAAGMVRLQQTLNVIQPSKSNNARRAAMFGMCWQG